MAHLTLVLEVQQVQQPRALQLPQFFLRYNLFYIKTLCRRKTKALNLQCWKSCRRIAETEDEKCSGIVNLLMQWRAKFLKLIVLCTSQLFQQASHLTHGCAWTRENAMSSSCFSLDRQLLEAKTLQKFMPRTNSLRSHWRLIKNLDWNGISGIGGSTANYIQLILSEA